MADDRILLNLALNEATVSAVEGRVRNLVNRLNNQNISVNVNGQSFDNLINKANTFIQRMQTINSTPININANLTSAQQQYRLETERMRISQQLELSRQRTLQTENLAVRALAEENRTMTINRNLTTDINGNIQHTHEHIRNAGNATNDFATGLGRSLQHILQYRVITEILNQITEAYRELKAVDTSMVGYRKVTGASKSEVNALTEEAFSKATKYGRLASEYAESTERFAKAGYNNKSSELSELALLSENVGDIDNNLANEFIVSSDAAWQLNGDITELTKILDMFNELSNKTATDVEKLASGITVSGSMFAQAGLSAQDYAAIIGTATAKTTRSGEEMSRAWRTIIMSLSQIRGTDIETGEIIDKDKLAKAEKTLNAVGIQLREIVDGQSELRNPMKVLGEIADKWESLSSIQQSALSENISGKRQSNAFISVIENWKDVEKAIEITSESSNSSIRENEIYLDSWSAKQKQVSAEWSEFISHMSNVETIKGTLDILASTINMIDTPLGRIVTQIVLVNTALAVSNRMWGALRARSIVADILSIGLAEGSLGTAIQLVTGHLWQQAAAWAATPFGMATITISAIAGILGLVDLFTTSVAESQEKLNNLRSEFSANESELQSMNGELETTRKRIAELENKDKLTFAEAEELENLRKQNNELQRSIDLMEHEQKIKNKEIIKTTNKTMKKQTLNNLYNKEDFEDVSDYVYSQSGMLTANWDGYIRWKTGDGLSEDDLKNREEVLSVYLDSMKKELKEWDETLTDAEYIPNPTTDDEQELNAWLDMWNDFKDKIAIAEGVTDAKENAFNRVVDNWQFDGIVQGLQDLGKEGKVTAEMLNNPKYKEFIQKLIDIGFIANDSTGSLRYVANAFNGVGDSANLSAAQTSDAINNIINNLSDEADACGLTTEEFGKLIGKHILFGNTNLNTQDKILALQALESALGDCSSEMKYLLYLFNAAAGNFTIGGATGMTQAEASMRQSSAEMQLASMFGTFKKIDIPEKIDDDDNGKDSGSSSGSSSGSNKNDALEKALDDAEKAYKIHQDELKYIAELEDAYKKYGKTAEEWAEIEETIEQARKDHAQNRIKDIEHENELLLNQGKSEKDLIDNYKEIQKIAKEEADRLRLKGYDNNSNEIQEWQNVWWDNQGKIADADFNHSSDWIEERNRLGDWNLFDDNEVDAWQRVLDRFLTDYPEQTKIIKEIEENLYNARKDAMDKELSSIDNYISARNAYNDWNDWSDSEIKAIRRKMDVVDEYYKNGILSLEEYNDKINELQQESYSLGKDSLIEAIEKEIEAYEDLKDREKEALDLQISKYGSLHTLLQAHYDVVNAISDAQYEINKELTASKTMYEYLNEETRKLLFNQEDYNELSETLLDIQNEVYELQRDYESDILSSTAENLDEITSKYQMQYETMMKKYEVAKAELEVAKKRQQLDNVLNERNVRMFINGQWQWVANTQDVINAQNELADAEHAKAQATNSQTQTLELNNLQSAQDALTTQVNNIDKDLEKMRKNWDKMQENLNGASMSLSNVLAHIALSDSPMLQNIILESGESIAQFVKDLTGKDVKVPTPYLSDFDYMEAIRNASSEDQVKFYNAGRNAKIIGEGLEGQPGIDIMTDEEAIDEWKKAKGFASGTRYTPGGLTALGEIEDEMFITNNGHLIPINQPTLTNIGAGGIVFNHDQMDFARRLWDWCDIATPNFSNLVNRNMAQTIDKHTDNSITIKNLTVDGGSIEGQALNDALRRYIAIH